MAVSQTGAAVPTRRLVRTRARIQRSIGTKVHGLAIDSADATSGQALTADGSGGVTWSDHPDVAADYVWTGTHRWTKEQETDVGTWVSHVADAPSAVAFSWNSDQSFTEDYARYHTAWKRNGTQIARIGPKGHLWLKDGMAVGISEGGTIALENIFSYFFKRWDGVVAEASTTFTGTTYDIRAKQDTGSNTNLFIAQANRVTAESGGTFTGNINNMTGLANGAYHSDANLAALQNMMPTTSTVFLSDGGGSTKTLWNGYCYNAHWIFSGSNYNQTGWLAGYRVQNPSASGSGNTFANTAGVIIEDLEALGTNNYLIYISPQVINSGASYGNIVFAGRGYDEGHLVLGNIHLFEDETGGTLRIKAGAPTSDTDGTDIAAGGSGESNTASNVGTDGVGVWYQKTGVDLEFRHVAPGSTKITTTLNGQDIDVDVAEANLAHTHDGATGGGTVDHTDLSSIGTNTHSQIDTHISASTAHGISGSVVGTTDTQTVSAKDLTADTNKYRGHAGFAIESPTTGDDFKVHFTEKAITISKMVITVVGTSTPSVTVDIKHQTSRNSGTPNSLISSPTASSESANNAESTGHVITSFDDATVLANSHIWVTFDAVSGTVTSAEVTIFWDED